MATYRTIAASETDSESPITQELMDALRLNPEAIAEGASGAPRVEPPALDIVLANGTADEGDGSSLTLCQALTGVDGLNFIMFAGRFSLSASGPGTSGDLGIFVQRSSNGGVSWETAIKIEEESVDSDLGLGPFFRTFTTPLVATGFDAARIRVEHSGSVTFDVSGFIIGLGV